MMMNKYTKRMALALFLLTALLVTATACTGGSGGDVTDDASGTTPDTAEPTGTTPEPTAPAETAAPVAPEETTVPAETEPETAAPEAVRSWGDNILISVPVWREQWATSEHMKLLQDAGVDFVVTVSGVQTATFSTSDKLIEAARSVWVDGKPGIRVMVHNTTMGEGLLGKNEAYVKRMLEKYFDDEAVIGYHVWDEPFNPTALTPVERMIKGLDPDRIADINFLPGMVYGTYPEYEGRVDDYAKIMGDLASYISFDNYPFAPSGQVDETALFGNFEVFRRVSLDNDVPSAFYLQAVGSPNVYGYMRATEGSLYYHTGAALAYGFKWIKYWSWYVPDYGDPAATYKDYTDSIMGKDGKPTEMYDVAKALHAEVHAIGPVLINLAPTEVYHTGRQSSNPTYSRLPSKCFVSAGNTVYSIVSIMTDRITGENYLMVVNKDYNKAQTLTYTLDGVDTLWEISRETGAPVEMALTDSTLSVELPAGGFALYRLPAGVYTAPEKKPAANVLSDARVTASYSDTGNGWFVRNAFDGKTRSTVDSQGYRLSGSTPAVLDADLGALKTFNRLTVYPAGTGTLCGSAFPGSVKLYVSEDGETYTELFATECERPTEIVPSYTLPETTARYVRLELVAGATGILEVAELKLYHDGGSYTEEKTLYKAPVIVSGVNVAKDKNVSASGSAYEAEGWGIARLTDGSYMQTEADGTNGWMSNGVKNVTDPVWACVDLAGDYPINKIVIYPRKSGERFPTGYYFEISTDGKTWTKVCEETEDPYNLEPRAFTFDTVTARYVRLTTTELRQDAYVDFAGGYMAQISEIEVYTE